LLNKVRNDEVSDTTGDATCTTACTQKIHKTFSGILFAYTHHGLKEIILFSLRYYMQE